MPKKAILRTDTARDTLLTSVTGAIHKVFSWLDVLQQLPEPPSPEILLQQFGAPKALKASKPVATPKKAAKKAAKAEVATPKKAPKAAKAEVAPKKAPKESTRTKPTMPQAVAIVMGSKVMGTADIIPLLQARGWAPETKNNLAQYISVIFSGNQGPGKIFERVDTGKYKVQDPSQFTALAKQYGGKTSGKAARVTASSASSEIETPEASDPPNSPDTDTDEIESSLSDLLAGTGFDTNLDGSDPED